MPWENYAENLAELAEVAEENALVELGALGECHAPFDTAGAEDWPDSWEPSWFDAWHAATDDYFAATGEIACDEVLGLV